MYSVPRSKVGAFPEPRFPLGIKLEMEDRRARGRLCPVTVVYTVQLAALLTIAASRGHPWSTLARMALAIVLWVPIEYWYSFFDVSHADHHARPLYVNGHGDSLLFAALAMPLTFLAPIHTAPVFPAALPTCYRAFGISNGIWDVVAGTRLPADVRRRLAVRRPAPREEAVAGLSDAG